MLLIMLTINVMSPLVRILLLVLAVFLNVGGLLILFYQPAMLEEEVARAQHIVPVLVDLSESHDLPHVGARRHELVSRFVARHSALWERLGARDQLVFHGMGAGLAELPDLHRRPDHLDEVSPSQQETRIVDALEALRTRYKNQSIGAVILLTDGIDTGPDGRAARLSQRAQAVVRSLDAPIYAFTLPDEGALTDLAIADVAFNPFAFLMNATSLDVVVRVHGVQGGRVTLRLSEGSNELASKISKPKMSRMPTLRPLGPSNNSFTRRTMCEKSAP